MESFTMKTLSNKGINKLLRVIYTFLFNVGKNMASDVHNPVQHL